MKIKLVIKNIIIIFGPLIGGIIISLIAGSDSYSTIKKPPLSPPGVLFPIAWSILYILMGISLLMVLKEQPSHKTRNIFIYQITVNYIWPILFFKLKLYVISALWIVLLLYLVINMIVLFKDIKKIAGYLQFPYFIWLLFALYLNIGVALLN